MPLHNIQPSFSGGEFAPSLYSRIDLAKYSTGLKTCRNMIIHPHGGVSNRPGTKFVAETRFSNKKSRLVPFEFSVDQSYVIEFGEEYCRFYAAQGQILASSSSMDDWNLAHTPAYTLDSWAKLGKYATLSFASSKKLYVSAPYGLVTTGYTIEAETNTDSDIAQAKAAYNGTITTENIYAAFNGTVNLEGGGTFTLTVVATSYGSASNKTITGNGSDTCATLIGAGYTISAGGSDILKNGESVSITGGSGGTTTLTVQCDTFGSAGNKTIVGTGSATCSALIGVGYTVSVGGSAILRSGDSVSISGGVDFVEMSDVLRLAYTVGTKAVMIKLADTTAAKNTAALIETKLRELNTANPVNHRDISGATKATECEITCTGHGFANNDYIEITSVSGMTQLNGNKYYVVYVDENHFKISTIPDTPIYIDSSAFGTYTSGGEALAVETFFEDFRVTHNSQYSAAPVTSGVDIAATSFSGTGGLYHCILTPPAIHFPPVDTTYWTSTSTAYEIATPYQKDDLENLKFAQSADIIYITHKDYAPRALTRFDNNNWTLEEINFFGGPFLPQNIDTNILMNVSALNATSTKLICKTSAGLRRDYFTSDHVGAMFKLVHNMPGQKDVGSFTAVSNGISLQCGKTWRLVTHGAWAMKIRVERSRDNGTTWDEIRSFSSEISGSTSTNNISTYGVEDEICLVRVVCYYKAPTGGTCSYDLTVDPWIQTGIFKVSSLVSASEANVAYKWGTMTTGQDAGSILGTVDWSEGAWSEVSGYPSCVTFYQDRLVLAASDSEPQNIWFSQTGDYYNFSVSNPLVDSDSITLNLPSRKMNGIKNIINLQEILALTSATEWSIGPGDTAAITPTSIKTRCEGYRGGSKCEPATIANRLVYVQPMGTVVADIGYDFSQNGYVGIPLSLFSNHLFNGYEIKEMAYQQEPDSTVWCVRDDGKALAMAYMREQEIVAWSWHDTDGLIESVCSIPGDKYNEVWFIVKRGTKRFVEYLVSRNAEAPIEDQFYVDCGISYDTPHTITGISKATQAVVACPLHGFNNDDEIDITEVLGMTEINGERYTVSDKGTNSFKIKLNGVYVDSTTYTTYTSAGEARLATDTISGLDHLEGLTVAILADGTTLEQQVVTSGSLTLPSKASKAHIGLQYYSDIETLNIEVGLRDGVSQDRMKKISQVTIRFLNSRGGYIGPDSDSLVPIEQTTGEPGYDTHSLFSGDYMEILDSNYEYGGRIFFRQVDPLPVTILSVMPTVTMGV